MSNITEKSGDQLLTPRQYKAERPEIGLNSIYKALKDKRLRHIRVGRKFLILASEVSDWPRREAEGTNT